MSLSSNRYGSNSNSSAYTYNSQNTGVDNRISENMRQNYQNPTSMFSQPSSSSATLWGTSGNTGSNSLFGASNTNNSRNSRPKRAGPNLI